MIINDVINELIQYSIKQGLIEESDYIYCGNKLIALLNINSFEVNRFESIRPLNFILEDLLDYAYENNVIESNDVITRDLLDTKIMDVFTPMPSQVQFTFDELYKISPKYATDYFYKISCANNYIRTDRIKKNISYKHNSKYGEMDITINLSKPEKDPKMIELAKSLPATNYPKCPLCYENVGFSGNIKANSRDNLRIVSLKLNGDYYLQYSPYVYYNEHCIVLNKVHTPMVINSNTFDNLFDFVDLFPHYFIGSNADLPIVGGSILSHDHYQGGKYDFCMFNAKEIKKFDSYKDVDVSYLSWPLDTIKLVSSSKSRVKEAACKILNAWRVYENESINIFDKNNNTITPILRLNKGKYELFIVLRNNYTSKEYPLGMYHPNPTLFHIKKENIGLIEVMGMAILPARLKEELEMLKDVLMYKTKVYKLDKEPLDKHKEWYFEIKSKYELINKTNVDEIVKSELGNKFVNVLEDCSVFKYSNDKKKTMEDFIKKALEE